MSLNEFNNRQKPQPIRKGFTVTPQVGLVGLAVVLLVLSFFGGMQYQKSKTPTTKTASSTTTSNRQSGGQFSGQGQGGFGGRSQRGNRAFGTVSAVSDSSITVTTRGGSSATYTITSSTTVTNDGQSGSISDIQTGDTVILTLDSSNTTNVTAIDINPSFGGPQQNGSSTSQPDSTTPNDTTESL